MKSVVNVQITSDHPDYSEVIPGSFLSLICLIIEGSMAYGPAHPRSHPIDPCSQEL